jgi:hypothetical protein
MESINQARELAEAFTASREAYHEARERFIAALRTGREEQIVPAHLDALQAFNVSERDHRRLMGARP